MTQGSAANTAALTCREFETFILEYLEGGLTAPQRRQFESHLDDCPHCGIYLDAYKASTALGKAAFDEPEAVVPVSVPEELISAVLAALERGPRGPS